MTITAIIKSLGEPRQFETTDMKGTKKTANAIDVVLSSGSDEYVATAYDLPAMQLTEHGDIGDVVLADLRFSTRTKKREDGSVYSVQAVSVLAIDIVCKETHVVY